MNEQSNMPTYIWRNFGPLLGVEWYVLGLKHGRDGKTSEGPRPSGPSDIGWLLILEGLSPLSPPNHVLFLFKHDSLLFKLVNTPSSWSETSWKVWRHRAWVRGHGWDYPLFLTHALLQCKVDLDYCMVKHLVLQSLNTQDHVRIYD